MKLIIISSSIRAGRQSDQVAYAIREMAISKGIDQSGIIDLAKLDIPHMSHSYQDISEPGDDLVNINNELRDADFMIFVSPEYNGTYTAQLKNAVDYFPKSHFESKPIGICSVSSGGIGGMRGALQLQQLVLALWAFPIPDMLLVSNVSEKFDQDRRLSDKSLVQKIDDFLDKLFWFTEAIVSRKKGHNE